MTNDQKQKNLRIYDAIAYEDALDASDRRDLTTAERDDAHRFIDGMRARVLDEQGARRLDTSAGNRIRPSILALARDAVERWLGEVFASHPGAVFAHRDFTSMSDHDLRTALEDALTLIERMA